MKLFLFNKFQHSVKMEDFCHRYHIETSALICSANQWTGSYMITSSVMKGSNKSENLSCSFP